MPFRAGNRRGGAESGGRGGEGAVRQRFVQAEGAHRPVQGTRDIAKYRSLRFATVASSRER